MTDETKKIIGEATRVLLESGAKEVYLFGSVAEGTDTPDSDIDLAVSGLPPESFFRAIGEVLMTISRDFHLIDLDDGSPFTEFLSREAKLKRVA